MYKYLKAILDIISAIIILILFAIPMIIIAIAIKLDSKGPVLFKQPRTGLNGKNFMLLKFRTMVADNNVLDFTTGDKHTKVGKFLRKTSLDELPQFFCIIQQKMSLIGPRPWIPEYYENMNEEQRHRCDVLPGITGLAQVKGRNNITIFDKINYDLEYIEKQSLFMDIKIIFLTIKTVLSKEGADAGKSTIQNELEDLKKHKKITKSIKQIKNINIEESVVN